jgi:hypothetical protein
VIDPDGIWPSGANTVNPSGGTAEIVLTGTDVKLTTGIQAVVTIPTVCLLYQNYPNPFNPVTKITYSIPGPNFITLNIFDLLGREIAQLVNEYQTAGTFSLVWDASAYPSGLYFCRLQVRAQHTGSGSSSDLFTETKKLILLK